MYNVSLSVFSIICKHFLVLQSYLLCIRLQSRYLHINLCFKNDFTEFFGLDSEKWSHETKDRILFMLLIWFPDKFVGSTLSLTKNTSADIRYSSKNQLSFKEIINVITQKIKSLSVD